METRVETEVKVGKNPDFHSRHYGFDAARFQKVGFVFKLLRLVYRSACAERVIELVRMFATFDVDGHRAADTIELVSAGVASAATTAAAPHTSDSDVAAARAVADRSSLDGHEHHAAPHASHGQTYRSPESLLKSAIRNLKSEIELHSFFLRGRSSS